MAVAWDANVSLRGPQTSAGHHYTIHNFEGTTCQGTLSDESLTMGAPTKLMEILTKDAARARQI